jgi:hypothetical protein
MDVFAPAAVADAGRPLLILLGRALPEPGTPDSVDNPKYDSAFVTAIAERGIVAATIDIDQEFRASEDQIPSDVLVAWRALRAIQDARAAVRYFSEDAANATGAGSTQPGSFSAVTR